MKQLTKKQIEGWMDRNDWRGSYDGAKVAIEDARSLHLAFTETPHIDPLGTKEDFENDVGEAERAYSENPSSKNAADVHAAKDALRRRWPNVKDQAPAERRLPASACSGLGDSFAVHAI